MALEVSPAGRRYGRRPDVLDPRDRRFAAPPRGLPPKVDLSAYLGPVKDQGDLGACTAFSTIGMREFLFRKHFAYEKVKGIAPSAVILSPLFLYYQERIMEGTVDSDSGAMVRTAVKALNQFGSCPEAEDPYKPANFRVPPTPKQYVAAQKFRGGAYHRLLTLGDMKACLASEYAFVLGMSVFESFESDAVANTGIMPMPAPTEGNLGGHAVLCYGYDDDKGCLLIRNSWSSDWGQNGNFEMPYAYVAPYVDDCWMCHLGPAW